jgi:hypothetical protein
MTARTCGLNVSIAITCASQHIASQAGNTGFDCGIHTFFAITTSPSPNVVPESDPLNISFAEGDPFLFFAVSCVTPVVVAAILTRGHPQSNLKTIKRVLKRDVAKTKISLGGDCVGLVLLRPPVFLPIFAAFAASSRTATLADLDWCPCFKNGHGNTLVIIVIARSIFLANQSVPRGTIFSNSTEPSPTLCAEPSVLTG